MQIKSAFNRTSRADEARHRVKAGRAKVIARASETSGEAHTAVADGQEAVRDAVEASVEAAKSARKASRRAMKHARKSGRRAYVDARVGAAKRTGTSTATAPVAGIAAIVAGATGALAAFFFDPQNGPGRRRALKERVSSDDSRPAAPGAAEVDGQPPADGRALNDRVPAGTTAY